MDNCHSTRLNGLGVRNNLHSFSMNCNRGILKSNNKQLIYNRKMPKFGRRRQNLDKQQLRYSKEMLSWTEFNKICRYHCNDYWYDAYSYTSTKHTIMLWFSLSLYIYIKSLHADLEDREARLRAQEEEMKERDGEINRLVGELRHCQAELQRQQV